MSKLSITSVEVTSVTGNNKSPAQGNVLFSDGKYYRWNMLENQTRFFGNRTIYGQLQSVMFHSEKRAKLLSMWLDSNDWAVTVFKVKRDF